MPTAPASRAAWTSHRAYRLSDQQVMLRTSGRASASLGSSTDTISARCVSSPAAQPSEIAPSAKIALWPHRYLLACEYVSTT